MVSKTPTFASTLRAMWYRLISSSHCAGNQPLTLSCYSSTSMRIVYPTIKMSSLLPWFLNVVTCLIVLQITCFIPESSASSNDDKITSLPGQPPVEFNQYAGYVQVENKSLFYYFVEAETNPQTKPLVLWFNGGPSCSSLEGGFNGHGPFKAKGELLIKNEFSWNQEANILFMESPVGVGFSYSYNTSFTNDEITAQENLNFLVGWLEKFPEHKNKDLFLTGVSYAGHYVPQLADLILESKLKSNLRGIAIGNPLLDFNIDYNIKAVFLWSHGLISDSTYSMVNSQCNFSQIFKQLMQPQGNLSAACSQVYNQVIADTGIIVNVENMLIDICNSTSLPNAGDNACSRNEVTKYFNKKDVQSALHAKLVRVKEWNPCTRDIGYVEEDVLVPTLPLVGKLVKCGVQVMIFSGDQDMITPFLGTRSLVNSLAEKLKLNTTRPYTSWLHNKQVGGWTEVYGEVLTFATVRGGGHDSTLAQPERTLALLNTFLQGNPLPKS